MFLFFPFTQNRVEILFFHWVNPTWPFRRSFWFSGLWVLVSDFHLRSSLESSLAFSDMDVGLVFLLGLFKRMV